MVSKGSRFGALLALFGLAVLALSTPTGVARAQRSGARDRGEEHTCILLLIREAVPATAEWSAWIGGGGGHSEGAGSAVGNLSAGGEVTFPFGRLSDDRRYGGAFLLRAGAWAGISSTFAGAVGEGGLLLTFGQAYHAQWGTFGLRFGVGYGDDLGVEAPHAVVTLTGGVLSALERYHERGACDSPAVARRHGWTSSIRLFATARASLLGEPRTQWIFGLEFTPSYFFPPYGLFRWGGGPPE